MNQITSLTLSSAFPAPATLAPADNSSLDFASVLDAHIAAEDAPTRATLDTSAISRRASHLQATTPSVETPVTGVSSVETSLTETSLTEPDVDSSIAEVSDAEATVEARTASNDAAGQTEATSSEAASSEQPAADVEAGSDTATDPSKTPAAEVVAAQLTLLQQPLPTPVVTAPLGVSSDALVDDAVLAPVSTTSTTTSSAATPSAPTALTQAAQPGLQVDAAGMTAAAVVELAVVTEAPAAALTPVTDSFESTLQSVTAEADQQSPLTTSLTPVTATSSAPGASEATPEAVATPTAPASVTVLTQSSSSEELATPVTPGKASTAASDQDPAAPAATPSEGVQQLRGATATSQSAAVKEPAGVVRTDNIRSEVWEIAKRAQELSRVEAVIRTSHGDLTVVARHSGAGVSVTLGGDALDSIDLAVLQNELQGLDVTVDQGQSEHRAPQDQQDTIPTRAAQPTRPTIRPTSQSPQGLLDTHA